MCRTPSFWFSMLPKQASNFPMNPPSLEATEPKMFWHVDFPMGELHCGQQRHTRTPKMVDIAKRTIMRNADMHPEGSE